MATEILTIQTADSILCCNYITVVQLRWKYSKYFKDYKESYKKFSQRYIQLSGWFGFFFGLFAFCIPSWLSISSKHQEVQSKITKSSTNI